MDTLACPLGVTEWQVADQDMRTEKGDRDSEEQAARDQDRRGKEPCRNWATNKNRVTRMWKHTGKSHWWILLLSYRNNFYFVCFCAFVLTFHSHLEALLVLFWLWVTIIAQIELKAKCGSSNCSNTTGIPFKETGTQNSPRRANRNREICQYIAAVSRGTLIALGWG